MKKSPIKTAQFEKQIGRKLSAAESASLFEAEKTAEEMIDKAGSTAFLIGMAIEYGQKKGNAIGFLCGIITTIAVYAITKIITVLI